MISLEDELESFLEATQDPAAWLMVCAAKDEIERLKAKISNGIDGIEDMPNEIKHLKAENERLNRELKLAQAGWRKGDADEFLEATQNANNALEIKE